MMNREFFEEWTILFVLYFVILVLALYLQSIIARKFENVAKLKGHGEEVHSFAMCFWLGLIGYLYVIALPDLSCSRSQIMNDTTILSTEQSQDNVPLQQYECPKCKTLVEYGTEKCPACQQVFKWNNQ